MQRPTTALRPRSRILSRARAGLVPRMFVLLSSRTYALTIIASIVAELCILSPAVAQPAADPAACANSQALGVSRVIDVPADRGLIYGQRPGPALKLGPKEVVLTFDDGPASTRTKAILDLLEQECLRATFFMLGKRIQEQPAVARMVETKGHTVGTHSWSHPQLAKLEPDAAEREITSAVEAAETALGHRPYLFRYPSYSRNDALDAFLISQKLVPFNVDLSPADWRGDPPDVSFGRLMQQFAKLDRGVVLLHDTQQNTQQLLPMLLVYLKENGFKVVHVNAR